MEINRQDRHSCLSSATGQAEMPVLPTILLIIDTISSIPLFPFEHKFCHNENCCVKKNNVLTKKIK